MQESIQVTLEKVSPEDIAESRKMVEEYWQELMPHAAVVKELDRELYRLGNGGNPQELCLSGQPRRRPQSGNVCTKRSYQCSIGIVH
jgi:hypothetical protein